MFISTSTWNHLNDGNDDLGPDPQRLDKQQPRAQKHIFSYLFNSKHCSLLWKDHMLSLSHSAGLADMVYPLTPPHLDITVDILVCHCSLLVCYCFVKWQQMLSPAFHMGCVTEHTEISHCLKKILKFGWEKGLAVVPWWDHCKSSDTNNSTLGEMYWELGKRVFLTTFYTLTADTQLWTIACSHVYTRNNTKYHSRLHWQSATGSTAIVKPHTHHGAWLRLASGLWVILHTPPPCIPCHISVLDLWRFIKRMEEGILDFHCFLASDKRAKKANTNSSTSVN